MLIGHDRIKKIRMYEIPMKHDFHLKEAECNTLACPLEGATGALELEDECIHGLDWWS